MTFWLWVIGAIAIIWPIILFWLIDRHYSQTVGAADFKRVMLQIGHAADAKFTEITDVIEQQDQLIAVLWDKVYGYSAKEGEYFIYSWELWPKVVQNAQPDWTIKVYQESHERTLQRARRYPWENSNLSSDLKQYRRSADYW